MQTNKAIVFTTLGLLTVCLSGCVQEDNSTSTHSPTSSVAQKPSLTPTPSATISEIVKKVEADVMGNNVTCDVALPPQALYELNPDLALVPDSRLELTVTSKEILALGGISCLVSNLSTSSDSEISMVKLTPASSVLKSQELAANSSLVSQPVGSDVTSYFNSENGIGQLQFVSKNYWVALASSTFSESAQATFLAGLVLKHLPG